MCLCVRACAFAAVVVAAAVVVVVVVKQATSNLQHGVRH